MPYIRRLGVIVATMTIIGCGSPSPDSPVVGQVGRSVAALPASPTSDRAKTGPGVNATVHQDPGPNYPARLPAPQNLTQEALLPNPTEVRQSTASLQAQGMWIDQPNDELAPMTYALADLESESEQAHALWLEQAIQEVTEFDMP